MYQAPEHLVKLGTANLEATLSFASLTLAQTEKLLDLQLRAARSALQGGFERARALADVKSVQDLVALQSAATQPDLQQVLDFSRDFYQVASDTQAQVSRLLESRVAAIGSDLLAAVDLAAKSAPTGTDSALATLRSAIASASDAFDALTGAHRPAAEAPAAKPRAKTGTARRTARRKAH